MSNLTINSELAACYQEGFGAGDVLIIPNFGIWNLKYLYTFHKTIKIYKTI